MQNQRNHSWLFLFGALALLSITSCSLSTDQLDEGMETPATLEISPSPEPSKTSVVRTPIWKPSLTSTIQAPSTSTPVTIEPTETVGLNAKGSIVVARNSEFDRGIYLFDIEKRSLQNLTPEQARSELFWSPSWSPDGSQIVYSFGREDVDLFLYDFKSQNEQQIFPQAGCNLNKDPDWSPDGKIIVFNVCGKIYLYSFSTGRSRLLISSLNSSFVGEQTWSPDGKSIAFLGSDAQKEDIIRIFIMDVMENKITSIAPDVSIGFGKISWSPDGQSIAFRSREGCGDICTVQVDNGEKKCFTHTPFGERDPSWSPDGHFITYVGTNENQDCNQEHGEPLMMGWQLYILEVESGNYEKLTDIPEATFNSPDWWLPK